MSVSSSELVKVETAQEPPPAAAAAGEKLAPGDVRYIGGALHGPGHPGPDHSATASGEPPAYSDSASGGYIDYGYGYWGGGGSLPPRPVPPPSAGGPNIGPNGFPIIAPPGTAGSVPPPIGSNGFPIIGPPSQPPPVAAPRKQ